MGQFLSIRFQALRKRTKRAKSSQRGTLHGQSKTNDRQIIYKNLEGKTTIPLPPELIDEIIDLIAQDKCTLYSCNLASRQLGVSAKRYIFRDVTLGRHNAEKFLQMIRINPHLGHVVRRLTTVEATGVPESASAKLIESCNLIFPHFICLTRLCLSRYQFSSGPSTMWTLILTELPVINHISLVSCTFSSGDDILQLVAAHPSLLRLDLWRVETRLNKVQASTERTYNHIGITSIGLETVKAVSSLNILITLCRGLRHAEMHIPLETLILSNLNEGDGKVTNAILSLLGENLKHFELDISADSTFNQANCILKSVTLSSNNRLRTLCLPLHMRLTTFRDRPSIKGVSFHATPHLISTCTSPDLIALTLRLYCYKGGGITELQVIDDLITGPRFSKLQYIRFEFIGCHLSERDFSKFEEALPMVSQRGLLTF